MLPSPKSSPNSCQTFSQDFQSLISLSVSDFQQLGFTATLNFIITMTEVYRQVWTPFLQLR